MILAHRFIWIIWILEWWNICIKPFCHQKVLVLVNAYFQGSCFSGEDRSHIRVLSVPLCFLLMQTWEGSWYRPDYLDPGRTQWTPTLNFWLLTSARKLLWLFWEWSSKYWPPFFQKYIFLIPKLKSHSGKIRYLLKVNQVTEHLYSLIFRKNYLECVWWVLSVRIDTVIGS